MKTLSAGLCLLALSTACRAQSVDAVLARMDKAAPSFHAMSANVQMVEYTALLSSKTTQTGAIEMQRSKPGDVRAILTFNGGQGDARTIAFLGKKLRVYYPKLNTYEDFEVGKNSEVVSQYLLLGFGSSGKELAKSYTISFLGPEKVAGQDTSKLQLQPTDPNVKQRLQKVLVWIPDDGANPVQQQFYEATGNYRLLTYTGISLSPQIKGTLELHLPSGAVKER